MVGLSGSVIAHVALRKHRQYASPMTSSDDDLPDILDSVRRTYDRALGHYGANHRGVGWLHAEEQIGRLDILAELFGAEASDGGMVIADLGCGYGIMFDAYADLPALRGGRYIGYDISADMLAAARARVTDPRASFIDNHIPSESADYGFASGTFNIKMSSPTSSWQAYIEETLEALWRMSRVGIGFNMTSSTTADQDHTLFYGDADRFATFCRTTMNTNVTVRTDYSPSEWTILVRR